MSHKSHGKHHPYCLNCHYPLSEFDKNCSQCGQKPTDGKTTMHDLLHEFIHTMFHLDGKFFWTLKHLFIPGKLTLEFFKGHHKRYAHPIQLFLVVGAFAFATILSKLHKAEEQIKESANRKEKATERKKFLMELDSVSLRLSESLKIRDEFHDSLMLKMIYPEGLKNNEENIRKEISAIIDKQLNKPSSKNIIQIRTDGDVIKDNQFRDSLINVLLDEQSDSIPKKEDKNDEDEENSSAIEDFKKGYKEGITMTLKEQLRPKVDLLKTKVNVKEAIKLTEDSISINGFFMFDTTKGKRKRMMPLHELYELSPDSILLKYPIEGFWNNVMTKQYLKTQKLGNNLFHFFMSKLFWATFAVIPALALFFLLMYRRQKRYYVEHVVFLMHYNTTIFLGLIATLYIFPYWHGAAGLFTLWVAVHFFLAIKNYYQQGWGKTFVKYMIINCTYFTIAMIFMILTGIIGFLLF